MVPNMTSAVVPEEVLALEPALPSQFHDIWSRSRYVSPERALVLAVLELLPFGVGFVIRMAAICLGLGAFTIELRRAAIRPR